MFGNLAFCLGSLCFSDRNALGGVRSVFFLPPGGGLWCPLAFYFLLLLLLPLLVFLILILIFYIVFFLRSIDRSTD